MADHPHVHQGKTNDFMADTMYRARQNFKPGRGKSLQTTERLDLRDEEPLPNSINKFLFLSKKRDANNRTIRQNLKIFLEQRKNEFDGYLHDYNEGAIRGFVNATLDSQKPRYKIVVRPLLSYSEKNADEKRCKYGAYKDGSRYRCAQNVNHKKGGGGDVTAAPSERTDDGDPDGRTKLQNRKVNVRPYVRKRPVRRADQQDTEPQNEEEEETEPQVQVPRSKTKVSGSRELKRLQAYLKDPKTAPISGKRKR